MGLKLGHMRGIELRGAQYLPSNVKVEAKILNPINLNINPGDTENHEAIHSYIAIKRGIGVKQASALPSGNALGTTILNSPDAVAAIGPHAAGCDGCGHDLYIVDAMGVDRSSASAAAKSYISEGKNEIHALACLLQEKKIATGGEMEERIKRFRHGNDVLITLKTPKGEEIKIFKEGVKDHVFLEVDKIYPLPARSEGKTLNSEKG